MTIHVLVSPAGPSLNPNKYGKEYYLLEHLARREPTFAFDAYFRKIVERPSAPNVTPIFGERGVKPDATCTPLSPNPIHL